ncbi:MAG TPA: VOC family protein [Allosphingosinicella sp.]|nr:VOC family protein [Allosphingosinicella sp.]
MADSRNPHGSFIWYELLTADPHAAAAFYGEVIGWSAASAGQPGIDYHIFSADGGRVAGHMKLPHGAREAGMRPGWLGYIGVDDVDAAVADIEGAGGKVHMPAMDLEGVGRMAMVADPQGVPFYVMRGESDEASPSFTPTKAGYCHWNELSTPDPEGALAFYTGRFGWEKGEVMPMGEMGGYQFIHHGGGMIGAIMTAPPGRPPGWNFAFGVRDIEEAARKIAAGGGGIRHGPVEVPGGDWVVMASDPQGAAFMAVGPRN